MSLDYSYNTFSLYKYLYTFLQTKYDVYKIIYMNIKINIMRFPKSFTKENKITFYTQRKKEMTKKFVKAMNEEKDLLSTKLNKEIEICEKELNKLL